MEIEKIKQFILTDKPKKIITENPTFRTFRQYIFGFSLDTSPIYSAYKPYLFESSMMKALDNKYICDKFVNWTIMLNLLYFVRKRRIIKPTS